MAIPRMPLIEVVDPDSEVYRAIAYGLTPPPTQLPVWRPEPGEFTLEQDRMEALRVGMTNQIRNTLTVTNATAEAVAEASRIFVGAPNTPEICAALTDTLEAYDRGRLLERYQILQAESTAPRQTWPTYVRHRVENEDFTVVGRSPLEVPFPAIQTGGVPAHYTAEQTMFNRELDRMFTREFDRVIRNTLQTPVPTAFMEPEPRLTAFEELIGNPPVNRTPRQPRPVSRDTPQSILQQGQNFKTGLASKAKSDKTSIKYRTVMLDGKSYTGKVYSYNVDPDSDRGVWKLWGVTIAVTKPSEGRVIKIIMPPRTIAPVLADQFYNRVRFLWRLLKINVVRYKDYAKIINPTGIHMIKPGEERWLSLEQLPAYLDVISLKEWAQLELALPKQVILRKPDHPYAGSISFLNPQIYNPQIYNAPIRSIDIRNLVRISTSEL